MGLQNRYNLLDREPFESDLQSVVERNKIGAMPFYGLARGFLSGKYRKGITVESVRSAGVAEYQNDRGYKVVDLLLELAKSKNSNPSAIALAWMRKNPAVSTPIASARTVEQLNEIIELVDLSEEEVELLSA
jgi:aryl-alcohol dehydrogenase-like predicted oxidoreductase